MHHFFSKISNEKITVRLMGREIRCVCVCVCVCVYIYIYIYIYIHYIYTHTLYITKVR